MLKPGVLVIGVMDVQRAATFWSRALGYERRSGGLGGWAVVLQSPDGSGMGIALQTSDQPPPDYPRVHLDLHVANAEEQTREVTRLLALGAHEVDWDRYPDDPDFVVLADPDGNRFCIIDLSHPS